MDLLKTDAGSTWWKRFTPTEQRWCYSWLDATAVWPRSTLITPTIWVQTISKSSKLRMTKRRDMSRLTFQITPAGWICWSFSKTCSQPTPQAASLRTHQLFPVSRIIWTQSTSQEEDLKRSERWQSLRSNNVRKLLRKLENTSLWLFLLREELPMERAFWRWRRVLSPERDLYIPHTLSFLTPRSTLPSIRSRFFLYLWSSSAGLDSELNSTYFLSSDRMSTSLKLIKTKARRDGRSSLGPWETQWSEQVTLRNATTQSRQNSNTKIICRIRAERPFHQRRIWNKNFNNMLQNNKFSLNLPTVTSTRPRVRSTKTWATRSWFLRFLNPSFKKRLPWKLKTLK